MVFKEYGARLMAGDRSGCPRADGGKVASVPREGDEPLPGARRLHDPPENGSRGHRVHTVEAYNRDILALSSSSSKNRKATLSLSPIDAYLGRMRTDGKSTRSIARAVSAIRSFYRFLLADRKITVNPLARNRDPEVQVAHPQGPERRRDGHALEAARRPKGGPARRGRPGAASTQPAFASRSWSPSKKSDVNLDAGYVIASGKRSKERIVPIGSYAREVIKMYLDEMKPKGPFLFPNRSGQAHDAAGRLEALRKYGVKLVARAALSPHAAPYLRNAPARRRRRPALGAAPSGARRYLDYADLYARGPEKTERDAQETPPARVAL